MKRIVVITLAAGLLSAGTPALVAQVSTNSPGQNETQSSKSQKQADRHKLMGILGLDAKELKGLTPQERRAKIKDASDQKITELQQKKTAGTITPQEQSDLAFLQQQQQHRPKKAKTDS
jgi:hypothetical protein